MKELRNLKLHDLSKAEMAKSEMSLIVGGDDPCSCNCSCSCQCSCSCSCSTHGTNESIPSTVPTYNPTWPDTGSPILHVYPFSNTENSHKDESSGSSIGNTHNSPYQTERADHVIIS